MKKQTTKKPPEKKTKRSYLLLEGAAIGAALGAGIVALAKSKAGQKALKQVKHEGEEFLKYLTPKVKKMKKMGETEYKKLVNSAMEAYNKDKKISQVEAKKFVKKAQDSWKKIVKSATDTK